MPGTRKALTRTLILDMIGRAPNRRFVLVHPGEMLLEGFMRPLRISTRRLAKEIDALEISQVIAGKRPISADLALRLGKFFGMSAESWMNLQQNYDLRLAAASAQLDRVKPLLKS